MKNDGIFLVTEYHIHNSVRRGHLKFVNTIRSSNGNAVYLHGLNAASFVRGEGEGDFIPRLGGSCAGRGGAAACDVDGDRVRISLELGRKHKRAGCVKYAARGMLDHKIVFVRNGTVLGGRERRGVRAGIIFIGNDVLNGAFLEFAALGRYNQEGDGVADLNIVVGEKLDGAVDRRLNGEMPLLLPEGGRGLRVAQRFARRGIGGNFLRRGGTVRADGGLGHADGCHVDLSRRADCAGRIDEGFVIVDNDRYRKRAGELIARRGVVIRGGVRSRLESAGHGHIGIGHSEQICAARVGSDDVGELLARVVGIVISIGKGVLGQFVSGGGIDGDSHLFACIHFCDSAQERAVCGLREGDGLCAGVGGVFACAAGRTLCAARAFVEQIGDAQVAAAVILIVEQIAGLGGVAIPVEGTRIVIGRRAGGFFECDDDRYIEGRHHEAAV